jgi:glutamate racemase
MNQKTIGIFDSGVGGLSVLREVRLLLPQEDFIYFADQAHVPYGQRPLREVRRFAEEVTRFLLARGAKVVVVACNTASAAALHHLREAFPHVPFVGMEPAVKPAAQQSRTRTVGVIATRGTFQGALFERLVDRFAGDVQVITQTCPGLVERIEKGDISGPETCALLEKYLRPLLQEGIDTLVLGCTHYPFAAGAIQAVVGPQVRLVDPAPAVALQVRRILAERHVLTRSDGEGCAEYFTSGNPRQLRAAVLALLREDASVRPASWEKGALEAPPIE